MKASPLLSALCLAACGGVTVVDDGAGGQGGQSPTTSSKAAASTTTKAASTTTGAGPCDEHADCPGGACIFVTGLCAAPCEGACDRCQPGTICDGCATSSCPECADCVAACVPTPAGRCDEDDLCPLDEVCIFVAQQCAPACDSAACADPNMVCDFCATGSCCACQDCVAACVPKLP
jgi:hypothetical protein